MSTYTPIASQTLGSAAASVTFSSIPQGYTDLVIVQSSQTSAGGYTRITFNSDTGSNYSNTQVYGSGTTAGTSRTSSLSYMQTGYNTASVQVGHIYQIMNYSNSTTYKTALTRWNDTSDTVGASVGLWRSTSAINSITLTQGSGNYNSGSTFSLYGIQVGTAAQKAQGGNIVTSDGTYVYHTFTSSGSFTPSTGLTVDYLVVAGGGGGGGGANASDNRSGGGGGAGGMRCTVTGTGGGGSLESALSLSAGKSYPVIVGAGGAAGVNSSYSGTNGSNSVFASITSTGGGGGGLANSGTQLALTGGSGGGGGSNQTSAAAGTANQGYAGGTSANNNNAGAGGGGAGAVGTNASVSTGGAGGTGVATSISGTSTTYAGGGGGAGATSNRGAGGTGGGGQGGLHSGSGGVSGLDASAGTANTGGGGGGGSVDASSGNPAAGGSGIVIIRYAL
jgi:hypothetical protein